MTEDGTTEFFTATGSFLNLSENFGYRQAGSVTGIGKLGRAFLLWRGGGIAGLMRLETLVSQYLISIPYLNLPATKASGRQRNVTVNRPGRGFDGHFDPSEFFSFPAPNMKDLSFFGCHDSCKKVDPLILTDEI